ncbi:hypothetical protein ACQ859_00930 [Roseateles chitinivorans]|uniref:hypothetical protein n=1 Tax=Roseateles chitinivorans TaxID=2917965 RepID=UPI003D672BBE
MNTTRPGASSWPDDCARIGLTSTSVDLAEIKRAYAGTLRVTRPDDDAAAYQALREAYDRVVAHARQASARLDPHAAHDPGPAIDDPATATITVTAAPTPSPSSAPSHSSLPSQNPQADDAVLHRSPQALCEWIETLVQAGREPLSNALPELARSLQAVPLSQRTETSIRMADLLIQLDRPVPPELFALLDEHFDWIEDFRSGQHLGATRYAALIGRLPGGQVPVRDPAVLEEYGVLVRLSQWLEARQPASRRRGYLAVLLMGDALPAQLERAGEPLRRRLGLHPVDDRNIRRTALLAQGVHLILMTALVWVLTMLVSGAPLQAAGIALQVAAGAALMQVAAAGLQLLLAALQMMGGVTPQEPQRKTFWESVTPWIAVAVFALAGAGGAVTPWLHLSGTGRFGMAVFCTITAFLLMPLPRAMILSGVLLWGGLVVGMSSYSALWAGFAAAWVAAGTLVLSQGIYRPESEPVRDALPRWPRGGPLAALLLGTVGLPTLFAWLATRCGQRVIMSTFMIEAGIAGALLEAHRPTWPALIAIPVGLAVMLAAQRFGWAAGRRLMAQSPAKHR